MPNVEFRIRKEVHDVDKNTYLYSLMIVLLIFIYAFLKCINSKTESFLVSLNLKQLSAEGFLWGLVNTCLRGVEKGC